MTDPQTPATDGPHTYKMDVPSDVTAFAVIQTTRNVVNDDGRGMTLRDEWWHIPTFVVDAIEAEARETITYKSEYRRGYVKGRADATDPPPSVSLHPGQHEFRTVCRLCGESGMLHVSVITPYERVTISDPRIEP